MYEIETHIYEPGWFREPVITYYLTLNGERVIRRGLWVSFTTLDAAQAEADRLNMREAA